MEDNSSKWKSEVKVLVTHSCLTLCNNTDCSPPGFSVQETLQARIMEWVAILSSWESSQPRDPTQVSCTADRLFYHVSHQGSTKLASESRSVMSDSLRPHGLCSPWNSPGQNTGEDSRFLLQGIFPTQDRTQVSCIVGRFFTSWAMREAPILANQFIILQTGKNSSWLFYINCTLEW